MEVKRILLPHQYYYPNMNLLKNRSGEKIEGEFYQTLLQADSNQMATIYVHVPVGTECRLELPDGSVERLTGGSYERNL